MESQTSRTKSRASTLRSARGPGVLGLALALGLTLGSLDVASATTPRTINLNTGYDQWSAFPALINVGQKDNEWRVILDPTPGNPAPPERPADVVTDLGWATSFPISHPSGGSSYPNSRWISINPNKTPFVPQGPGPSPPPTSYQYVFYFTLPPGFTNPQLTMALNADDSIIAVTLNNCGAVAAGAGAFNAPPLQISFGQMRCFRSGPTVNVLTVTVEDSGGVFTGLIVAGTVDYDDCDRQPVCNIPGLQSITFWESTLAAPAPFTFPVSVVCDPRLLQRRLNPLGTGNNDFEGVPGAEFYDVFVSSWDGTFNPLGEFVTIEAVYDKGAPFGGGLNIARVDLDGTGQHADAVASFVVLGDNAIPLGVGTAVDGNLNTDTTMGSTIQLPGQPSQRLRVTVGFPCCAARPSGMVAWYPLDETTGDTVVHDVAPPPASTGSKPGTPLPGGQVGPPNGPGPVIGQVNGALYFAGPYVQVPHLNADLDFGTGDLTIDAWVTAAPLIGAGTNLSLSLIAYKVDAASGVGYAFYLTQGNSSNPGRLEFVMNGTTFTSNPLITTAGWHHVAVTVDRGTTSPSGVFYIDGQYAGSFVPITASIANGNPLLIGASFLPGLLLPNGGRQEFAIDELEIFNRALSPAEVQAIHDALSFGKCRPVPGGQQCNVTVRKGCVVAGSAAVATTCEVTRKPYVCAKPISELTMTWQGPGTIYIRGTAGVTPFNTGPINPGDVVTVSGYDGSAKNVFWDIYDATNTTKIGQSVFDLACSDVDMNGPDDCGKTEGDAKGTAVCSPAPCANQWTLAGMAGGGQALDCASPGGTGAVTYRYEVTNKGAAPVDVGLTDHVTAGDPPVTTDVPVATGFSVNPGETKLFDVVDIIGENTTDVAGADVNGDPACTVASNEVVVNVVAPPTLCPAGAASLVIKGKDVSWDLTDPKNGQKSEIKSIVVVWPTGSGALREVKLGGPKIFSGSLATSPATIDSFNGKTKDRTLDDGKKATLKLHFDHNAASAPYAITVDFTDGCSVEIAKL
jgi:hypothetical protein